MRARSDLGNCKNITSITYRVLNTILRWNRMSEINWTVSLSQYATTTLYQSLKKLLWCHKKLLNWMKKRGIVRTVKNSLPGR